MLDKEELLKIANNNYGETEIKREESLILLNEWMDQHKMFKNLSRNRVFLLSFLRRSKFNMNETFSRMEKFFSFQTKYPRLYTHNEPKEIIFSKNLEMLKAGVIYRLIDKDENGRVVFVIKSGNRDTEIYDIKDYIRLLFYFHMMNILEDESLQITGNVIINDFDKMEYRHLISLTDLRGTFEMFTSSLYRQKLTIVLNLKAIVYPIISIWKLFMSKKLKSRFHTVRKSQDIADLIKPTSILPIGYGGNDKSEKEMIEFTIEIFKKHFNEVYDILMVETQ